MGKKRLLLSSVFSGLPEMLMEEVALVVEMDKSGEAARLMHNGTFATYVRSDQVYITEDFYSLLKIYVMMRYGFTADDIVSTVEEEEAQQGGQASACPPSFT